MARGARPAPSPWREPMGRARGGRVRASPPFCESITRSRWVGSCYSGASTPSPAGLLCVQWTGKYCLSALPYDLLALHLSPRRRLGLLGAAARASLRLRPGSRAPPGSLPSLGLGRGRGGGCRGGARRAAPPGLGGGGPGPSPARFRPPRASSRTHAAVARPFPLPVRVPRARAFFRAPRVSLSAPRTPFARPVWPFPLPVEPPRLRAQRSAPLLGFARARSFPPRGLCPRPPPPAAGPGAARRRRPPARKGAGPPPPPPAARPLPGYPQRMAARPAPGPGRGPPPPLFPPAGGGPGRPFPERELARRACGDPGATPASGRPLGPCLPCSQWGRRLALACLRS